MNQKQDKWIFDLFGLCWWNEIVGYRRLAAHLPQANSIPVKLSLHFHFMPFAFSSSFAETHQKRQATQLFNLYLKQLEFDLLMNDEMNKWNCWRNGRGMVAGWWGWKPITFYSVIKNLWFLWRKPSTRKDNHPIPFRNCFISWAVCSFLWI